MGLNKGNVLSIIFILFLILTLLSVVQMQQRYIEAKAVCEECWGYRESCLSMISINPNRTNNLTYDDLFALGESQG